MTFYHETENAKSYADMCEGYVAAGQLGTLFSSLPDGSSLLELGSGPGNDLALLAPHYQVTASDYSPAFIDMLRERFPKNAIKQLDAVGIDCEGPFDAIFSNKLLHHLTDNELAASFRRQAELLGAGGLVFHLIWRKLDPPEGGLGLVWEARDEAAMQQALAPHFQVLETFRFGELADDDSIAILARKIG